jgi:DNA polymerase IV
MDAFYASVEQRDNPSLKGRPVIVGGHPTRGVVTAASYEVRPFGVRSAMPMSRALKLAPKDVVVLPPRFEAYVEASEKVFAIFESFTPLVESLSLDEAFLDVTASRSLFGSAWDMAKAIRTRIADQVQLPASAGIAPVKFIAKIVSDLAKPNGQKEVREGEQVPFLAALPISRLWGVGPKTEQSLKSFGLHTIGDVARKDRGWLEQKLGSAAGTHLWELANGLDDREVIPDRAAKSIGAEDTFDEDLEGIEALRPHIHSQALRVGRRLRRAEMKSRVVQLKIKLHDFTLITRQMTLKSATDDGQELYRAAMELLQKHLPGSAVRLTGVSAQDLGTDSSGGQLGLFPEKPGKKDVLNRTLDKIAERYGGRAVITADLSKE